MLRRLLLIAVSCCLLIPVTAGADQANILNALIALNKAQERFSTPEQAEATAKEFFELVRTESGSDNAIAVLKELKRNVPQTEWRDGMRRAENSLMRVVQQTLDTTIVETVRQRTSSRSLGSIIGYGYSGKWPLKPETQLTFDGDFDASFFGIDLADTNPQRGIIAEVSQNLRARLGVEPTALGIVFSGFGWEAKADVYVTSAGKTWAIRQSMTRLYLIDTVTGAPIEITGYPDFLYYETQMQLLSKLHPEFFESGRLKSGVKQEQIRQTLMEDPRLGSTFKIWLADTRYTPGQAAAGVIDMTCHVAETAEATTPLEQRTKVAKQVARSNNIFLNAMDGAKLPWREFFSPEEIQFMRECASLDRAKITFAEAEAKRINFLLAQRAKGAATTEAELAQYQQLKVEAETARGELAIAERLVMDSAGSETSFIQRSVNIMHREAQIAHREFVIDLMGRPAAERAKLLADYEADLRALLDHYSKKPNVPPEAIEWAQGAYDSVKELSRVANENARALEGFGPKFMRLWEMFNAPVNSRENVRNMLGETPMGRSLLERIPEWAFANQRPPALTDIAFASPVKLVADLVVAPVNQTVNTLMMIDLMLQLSDVWSGNQTDVQKLVSCGEIVAMMVVPHLYLVPMVYQASLTGDPKQLAYVVACYICPPAMLPMLVDSLGTRVVSGAKRALFQSELEAMFQASTFDPADGQEPQDWETNRDGVTYTWVKLDTELDSYGRSGERSLATYIRILSSDTRQEIPLSQPKKMSGLQAIYLPGGVAKSFRAMIEDGDHRLFRENQALAEALSNLQKFNCDRLVPYMDKAPSYCRYAWAEQKSGIRLDLINNNFAEGEEARLQAEGKAGESMVKIVRSMLDQRAKLQNDVVDRLAEAIIISFEEEKRARKLVELGLIDDNLKELLEIGRELAIRDELKDAVSEALRKEGVKLSADQMDKTTGGMNDKARQDIAKVTDQWIKSYRYIADTRRSLVGLTGGYGVPKTEIDHFLRGKPPLQVIPGTDVQSTQTSREVIMNSPKDASGILFRLKGESREPNPMDSEAETTLLKYLFTARIMELTVDQPYTMIPLWQEGPAEDEKPEAFAERARGGLQNSLDMKNKSFWGSPPDFSAYLDRYYLLARGYAEKFAELRDRYRNDFQLAIEGSREVEAEKDVSLKVVPTRKGKPAGDALKDARIEWVVNQSVQNRGLTWWFSPLKEETINITVNAVRDVKGKPVILATATHQLVVKKKQEDTKPDDKKTDDKTKDSGQPVAATDPIDTAKLSFAGSAPDIWEGGNYDNGGERGFYMKRKKASSKGTGDCKWEAYVESTLWGKIDPTFGPGTEGEILSELNRQVEDAKGWGKTGQIRTAAIGDFKGHFMDTSVKFSGGGWSDAGFRGDGVSAEGRGYLIKGQRRIEIGYNVAGGGCWTNEDRPFLESQAHAAQDDAKAVLAGLQLVVNGTMTKTPYNGPKLDGSDMPKVTLSPPSVEKLKIGDTVNVQAVVENAKPENSPIGYNWGGTFDGKPEDMKTKASVKIKPSKPGKYTLSVSVDGAQFNLGSASLAYEVADYKVKLERIPADNKPVAMGGKVRLKAVLTVDGKETTGNFIFRWQPNTEVTFSNNEVTPDPKLPRNETDAVLTKTGRIKIWVEVLDPRGSTSSTVATSDPIEVEAVQPKLKLSYEPKKPMTGQEVKITVQEEPKMPDETISFWWEIKGEAISPGPALNVPNSRAYSFKPKDTRPITVTVHAKAKDGGNELGSENITIEPQSYSVSISEPRYQESPPQVWRCDTQPGQAQHCAMVTLKPNEFAVFRDIFLKVTVTPQPESPRYKWTVDPSGSCGFPGAGSEIKLNCSSTGTYTAKVEVASADGAKLGEASQPVAVSVSQRDLDGSKNAKDAYDKLQRAKEMVAQGKLDEGIPLVEEASKLDPKNTEASGLAAKWKKDRDDIKLHITRMDQLLKEDKIADAQKEFQPAQGVHPKYPPVVEAGKRLQGKQQEASQKQGQAQKLKAEGNALEAQGKLQDAINKYGESIRITPDSSLEARIKQLESKLQQETQKKDTADKLWQEGMTLFNQKRMSEALAKFRESVKAAPNPQRADYVKKLEAEQSAAQKLNDEGAALQKQGKLPDAIARYKESIRHWPNPDLEKQVAALEDEARKKADQSRQDAQKKGTADNLWQEGMTLFNQKRMSEALAKFRESVKAAPNPQRADYVKKLEAEQSAAQKLNDEGAALQKQGKLPDAIARYKESIRHWPNADLEKQIAAMEVEAKKQADQSKQDTQKKTAADKLWQEGTSLFNQGRPGEALAKFKESLNYLSSPERAKYVQDLEGRKTQAERLRNEGASLQNQGKLREAAGKYRESLGYWPDPGLKDHIAKIEAEIKKQETQVVTQPTGSDASNASFPLQISRNVANQNSSAFKQNVRRDLSMDTTQWDKIPYSVHVSSHDLMITTPAKFCLAGDAGGTKGWSVDNFLLIEVLDQSGNLTSSALAGNTETVRRNGNPIEVIGRTSFSFNACEIDITKLLPVGKPFRLRASAMDYGGVGYVSDVFIVSSKGTSGVVSQSPSPSPSAKGKVIFTNGNTGGVYNNPSRATTFTLREPHVITLVTNYHWNNGRGATPGTIALRGSDGRTYGPWRAAGSPGQGGVPNADWNAAPNVTLPAGTYTVVDSDPSTWAQNSESGGAGHTRVEGYPAGGAR